jgi:hypothetical protein
MLAPVNDLCHGFAMQNSAQKAKAVSGIQAILRVFLLSQLMGLDLYLSARNGMKSGKRKGR